MKMYRWDSISGTAIGRPTQAHLFYQEGRLCSKNLNYGLSIVRLLSFLIYIHNHSDIVSGHVILAVGWLLLHWYWSRLRDAGLPYPSVPEFGWPVKSLEFYNVSLVKTWDLTTLESALFEFLSFAFELTAYGSSIEMLGLSIQLGPSLILVRSLLPRRAEPLFGTISDLLFYSTKGCIEAWSGRTCSWVALSFEVLCTDATEDRLPPEPSPPILAPLAGYPALPYGFFIVSDILDTSSSSAISLSSCSFFFAFLPLGPLASAAEGRSRSES